MFPQRENITPTRPQTLKTKILIRLHGTKRKIHKSKMLKMQRNSDYLRESLN